MNLTKAEFDTLNAVRDTLIAEYQALDDELYNMSAINSINTVIQDANRMNILRDQISQLTDKLYG